MAAETLTIANGTTTITGARMSSTLGIKVVYCRVDGKLQELTTYHIPGTNGNYVVRKGTSGTDLSIRLRFIGPDDGSANDPFVVYKTVADTLSHSADIDAAAWIITYRGQAYNRCEVSTTRRVTDPKPTGHREAPTNYVWFDADFRFVSHE